MTFPRHFDCTSVNTRKYEFSTISGRRAIGTVKGRQIFASFSWGFESVCFLPGALTQLYFSVSIDVAKFYVRNSFSVLDRTFETRLHQQPPAGVESGKIGMKI